MFELGYKDIVYIFGFMKICDVCYCLKGYKWVFEEVGVFYNFMFIYEGNYEEEDGKIGLFELLFRDIFFFVLVCVNDWMVFGVMSCVWDFGMSLL